MKCICFINSYNNEEFIRECLESVYSQTHPFDGVIVVDDGSTDKSIEIILEFSERYANLLLLQKGNEGQFSSFNAVLPLIPDQSQIFLLDGDDTYPMDYLGLMLSQLGVDGWDFAFCEQKIFFNDSLPPSSSVINQDLPHQFGLTSALTRSRGCWIGNPTSCISLSSDLYKKIFPYPYFRDKSFWADNLMIYAASILGARKVSISSLGIGWRCHPSNNSKRPYSSEDIINRDNAIKRAFDWYCSKYNIPRYPGISEFFAEYQQLGEHWQKKLDLPSKYRMLNRLIRNSIEQILR